MSLPGAHCQLHGRFPGILPDRVLKCDPPTAAIQALLNEPLERKEVQPEAARDRFLSKPHRKSNGDFRLCLSALRGTVDRVPDFAFRVNRARIQGTSRRISRCCFEPFQERAINRKSLLPRDVFRKDAVVRSDLAIVIGTSDAENLRHRIAEGIALFTSGKVAGLLLTGDGSRKHPSQRSEADRMREAAVASGVPASAILIEDRGQDPESSAKECARLFKSDSLLSGIHSVILVSSAWHLLRTSLVMRRHLPNRVSILCHPTAEGVTADNWQLSPQGRALVENEVRLVEKLLKSGYSLR